MSLLCINWPLWNATRFEPSQPNINQEGRFWGLEDSSKKRLSSSLPRAGAGEAEAGVWWSGRPQRPIRECTIPSLELCKLEMPVEVFQKIYIRMPASSRILMSGIMVLVQAKLCPALCDPMDCSPPGFAVHGFFQAMILEWVVISSSRGIFLTQGLKPHLLHWQMDFLPLSELGSPISGLQ